MERNALLTDKARYDKIVESLQDIINRNLCLEDLYLNDGRSEVQ